MTERAGGKSRAAFKTPTSPAAGLAPAKLFDSQHLMSLQPTISSVLVTARSWLRDLPLPPGHPALNTRHAVRAAKQYLPTYRTFQNNS